MAQSLAGQQGALAHHVETFLRLEDVKTATGLGRSTIYLLMAEASFPKPVKLNGEGGKAVAWLASEIAEWQRQRVAARDRAAA
ncbi:AlpA family transcriptional regulator [Bradyrhizobium sp. B097]|uniref:AlpA family transcriptional regulator n=1 Tax=Bradyrhizobium sp. B097 TaxID=3140244 RepID=UPI00318339B6